MIPRSPGPKEPFQLRGRCRHQGRQVACGWGADAKEEVGRGGGAHREWCSVGERGDGERLWVSAWCKGQVRGEGAVKEETQKLGPMNYVCLLL